MNLDRSIIRARQIEEAIRERALLPVNLDINGIEVRQFNLEHWLILLKLQSPFLVAGGEPDAVDIGTFLWIVSPEYDARSFGSARGLVARLKQYFALRRRQAFLARVTRILLSPDGRGLNFVPRIRLYLKRAFMDRPATSSAGKPIAASLGASMTFRLMYGTYGAISREEARTMPLNEAFQYLNWIGANQPQFNPMQTAAISRFYAWQDRNKPLNGAEAHG